MTDDSKRLAVYTAAGALGALAAWQCVRKSKAAGLRGQVVAITGGSRGLGLQLARDFAKSGCKVAVCARDQDELNTVRREFETHGAPILTYRCDVSDRAAVEKFIAAVISRFGQLDVLVNNAGIIQVGPIESMTIEDFEQAMQVMFWGVLYPTWAAMPHMIERGAGRIVTITSIGGKVATPHMIPYSCAKFAAVALSEGLRAELAPKGIQVLTIVPGLMRTGSFLNALFKGKQKDEFEWFGLSANLPGMSMDVERASSQIIGAMLGGRSEHILTLPAQLLARFHGAFPELSGAVMALVNRYVLPDAEGGSKRSVPGHEVDAGTPGLFRFLTSLGRAAAVRMNEQRA